MTQWLRLAAVAIYAKPIHIVMLLMTACAWGAAAEIYSVVLQVPRHGESAAIVLLVMDVVYSLSLVFALLIVLGDLEELRIPQLRPLRAAVLFLIIAFAFVAPCAFVWLLGGPAADVFMIALGSAAGTGAALLGRATLRARTPSLMPVSAGIVTAPSFAAEVPRPWRAVRLALGPPYASTSWRQRLIELAVLCAVLAGAPLLLVLFEGSLNPRGFLFLLHIAQFVSFLIAIGLCWLWPLMRVAALFVSQSGTLTELALLPGQGSGGQQLRRLCLVGLSVPAAALFALLLLALGVVAVEHLPHAAYLKVVVEFALIPLLTLPVLASRLTKPKGSPFWAGALIMYSQTWTWFWIVWSVPLQGWHSLPAMFRGAVIAVIAIGTLFLIGLTVYSLRKLLQRPHPFVEVSS